MNVPNVSDEINRKVVETMELYAIKHQDKEITDGEFKAVTHALWEATSGLASSDTTHMLADISDQLKSDLVKSYFLVEDKVIMTAYRHEGTAFAINIYMNGNIVKQDRKSFGTNEAMLTSVENFNRALLTKGTKI